MRTRQAIQLLLLAGPNLVLACSSAGTSRLGSREPLVSGPPRRESASRRISSAELANVAARSLEDALRQLRPEYMRAPAFAPARSPGEAPNPSVYLNDVFAGGTGALNTIPIAAVVEVRFLPESAAHDWYGAFCRCDGGVILITTRSK